MKPKTRVMYCLAMVAAPSLFGAVIGEQDFTLYFKDSSRNVLAGTKIERVIVHTERKDGSFGESSGDGSRFLRQINLRPEMRVIHVADHLQMKSTRDYAETAKKAGHWPRPPRQFPAECAPPARIERTIVATGTEVVLGVATLKYLVSHKNPEGDLVETETWFAPSLGCHAVRSMSLTKDKQGKVIMIFEKTPLRLQVGYVEEKLLTFPPTYAEVKPSVLEKAHMRNEAKERNDLERINNFPFPQGALDRMDRQDKEYQALLDGTLKVPSVKK